MRRNRNEAPAEGVSVQVKVDATKIVRCICIAGVLIIGIIFGTRCYLESYKEIFDKN